MVRKTREEMGKENVAKERNVTDLARIKFSKARRERNLKRNVEKGKIAIYLKIIRKVVKTKRGRM